MDIGIVLYGLVNANTSLQEARDQFISHLNLSNLPKLFNFINLIKLLFNKIHQLINLGAITTTTTNEIK